MSFFDWFKSGPKAAEKVLDAGIAGLDKLVLTDEERLDYHKKLADNWMKLQELLGPETSVRGITRRVLTFLTVLPYTVLIMASAGAYYWSDEYAKFLMDLADGKFGIIVLTIVVFYFGPLVGRLPIFNGKKE